MNIEDKVIKLAIEQGYDSALYSGTWNDYDVYSPIFWDDDTAYVGLPEFILVKDSEVRWTNNEEWQKVLDEIEKSVDNRVIENIPIDLPKDLTIKTFKFERDGFFENCLTFVYKAFKNKKVLSYNEWGGYEYHMFPCEIELSDTNFDKYVLGMIKYFYKDLGNNPHVLDGEGYTFSATLSNGQKLKSKGYNYFPPTYDKLITYLEYLIKNDNKNLRGECE